MPPTTTPTRNGSNVDALETVRVARGLQISSSATWIASPADRIVITGGSDTRVSDSIAHTSTTASSISDAG